MEDLSRPIYHIVADFSSSMRLAMKYAKTTYIHNKVHNKTSAIINVVVRQTPHRVRNIIHNQLRKQRALKGGKSLNYGRRI